MKINQAFTVVLFIAVASLTGCAAVVQADPDTEPAPGQFGAPCGFDKPECAAGLECFGTCTFECGEKYSEAGDYGLDQPSVDRCAEHGGTCEQHSPTVQINVCKVERATQLPPTCAIQPESVRLQLCPKQAVSVVCSNVEQTNVSPGHCAGPDWTEGQQTTGNTWCCDATFQEQK